MSLKFVKRTSPSSASMIDVLKKGLKFLRKRVASRKEQLEADLKAGNFISAEDEAR
jgi:hypothetical protein